MASFETKDGVTIKDGEVVTLFLLYDSEKIEHRGTVRAFSQVELIYEDGIAVGKTTEVKWEISTDDPMHPAIGIRPETVLAKDS